MQRNLAVLAALVVATALAPVAAAGAVPTTVGDSATTTGAAPVTAGSDAPAAAAAGASQDAPDCSYPVTMLDATGHHVTIDGAPERVVTLQPSAAQTMYEIGAWETVVGVSQFATFLPGAGDRATVTQGNPSQVQVEKVIGLQPDLVVAPNTTSSDAVRKLRQAGITVYKFEAATSIADVYEKTRLFGTLSGNCKDAEATATEMEQRIDAVRAETEDMDSPRTLYLLGGGYTPGPGSFVHEMLTVAGGHNIAADADITFYGQISNEVIVEEDPEVLVVSYYGESPPEDPRSLLPDNAALEQTTAYEEGNVVAVNANNVSQPAPRVVSAIETLSEGYARYAESQQATTATPTDDDGTATPTPTDSATPTEVEDEGGTSGGGLPGFGLPAALLAVGSLAGLAARGARN